MIFAAVTIGPAISAAQGHGTRGYFIAQTENCRRGVCTWSGDFKLPNGAVTRSGVDFSGSYPGMHAGSVVPALDTGDFSIVFSRHGSDSWRTDLLAAVIGIGMIAQWVWTGPLRARRQRMTSEDLTTKT